MCPASSRTRCSAQTRRCEQSAAIEHARIVDDGSHRLERFRLEVLRSMRERADSSSAGVSAPCSASHSETAAARLARAAHAVRPR